MLGQTWAVATYPGEDDAYSSVDNLLQNILISRGITDMAAMERFLNPSIKDYMPDPSVLHDMDKAVAIIADSLLNNEKIAIYGDQDVDGITSTAVFVKYLKALSGNVVWHLPTREGEGYGLNKKAIEEIAKTSKFDIGSADKKLQSYCFRMCATKEKPHVPWPKPDNYRPERFEILKRYVNAAPSPDFWDLRYRHGPVKLNEGDCNNAGPVSIDHVGANFGWAEGSYAEREKIFQDHVNWQKGFMYFLANDKSIPESLRKRVSEYGLDAGEFPETEHWPHELYVREARRMLSDYVMTQANCTGNTSAPDSVGLASYTMDSHHVERVVKDGTLCVEGGFEERVKKPYPVSYKSIVPKKGECSNLFVPVALSASHVAFGSIRMEPVFMLLGQSAATAASMAIDDNIAVQDVNYPKLRERLLRDKQILDPKQKRLFRHFPANKCDMGQPG